MDSLMDRLRDDCHEIGIPTYFKPRLVMVPELPFNVMMNIIISTRNGLGGSGYIPGTKEFEIQTPKGDLTFDFNQNIFDLGVTNAVPRIRTWRALIADASPRPEIRHFYPTNPVDSAVFLAEVSKVRLHWPLKIMDAKTYVMMRYLLRAIHPEHTTPDLASATFAYADLPNGRHRPLALSAERGNGIVNFDSLDGLNYIRHENQGGARLVVPLTDNRWLYAWFWYNDDAKLERCIKLRLSRVSTVNSSQKKGFSV